MILFSVGETGIRVSGTTPNGAQIDGHVVPGTALAERFAGKPVGLYDEDGLPVDTDHEYVWNEDLHPRDEDGKFTSVDGGGDMSGGGSSKLSAAAVQAFASAPNGSKSSPAAKKWRKQAQELYDKDPGFRAAADALTLFTQGDYRIVDAMITRATTGEFKPPYNDSALPKWWDENMEQFGNAMADYKANFEGQAKVGNEKELDLKTTWREGAAALVNVIDSMPPSTAPVYRGVRFDQATQLGKLKEGDTFAITGLHSFTTDSDLGYGFAEGRVRGQRKASSSHDQAVIELLPGAKLLDVSALSPWNQKEVVTRGNFRVKAVTTTKISDPKYRYGQRDRHIIQIEQVS